jgi:hypothetical protein
MSETDRPGDDTLLALLYAAGELRGPAAAAFECRLADDQAARDALADAVRLGEALAGRPEPAPDPAYRRRVLLRLRAPGLWRRVVGGRVYRGHPSLWALAGAAAAALILLPARTDTVPDGDRDRPPPAVAGDRPAPPPAAAADDAEGWPDLMRGRHLTQTWREELQRRKLRAEGGRVVRLEEGAAPPRAPVYRQ